MSRLLKVQGLYYLATGLWPILHLQSFLRVTGDKTDLWLIATVGGLLAASGFASWIGGLRDERSVALGVANAGQALVLLGIDVFYVRNNQISPVYLFDAIPQVFFFLFWIVLLWRALDQNDVSFYQPPVSHF